MAKTWGERLRKEAFDLGKLKIALEMKAEEMKAEEEKQRVEKLRVEKLSKVCEIMRDVALMLAEINDKNQK